MPITAENVTTNVYLPGTTNTAAENQEKWNEAVWQEFNEAITIANKILGTQS